MYFRPGVDAVTGTMAKKAPFDPTLEEPVVPPAKPPKVPRYAKNQTHLASLLQPPRDRKIVQLALKLADNPGKRPDGRYNVKDWQTFVNIHFGSSPRATEDGAPNKLALECERLRLNNKKLEFELSVKNRTYSANEDIDRWVSEMVMNAKRVLLHMPGKLAPTLAGRDEVQIELILKEQINDALSQLSSRPWRDTTTDGDATEPAASAEA